MVEHLYFPSGNEMSGASHCGVIHTMHGKVLYQHISGYNSNGHYENYIIVPGYKASKVYLNKDCIEIIDVIPIKNEKIRAKIERKLRRKYPCKPIYFW